MLFVEKNIEPHHVYLRGARVLRKDIATKINIAIDGPAGSGKSTMAKALAKSMNILYLDTGAMYRACALKALKEKRDLSDETDVIDCMRGLSLEIEYEDGAQKTILDGEDVSSSSANPKFPWRLPRCRSTRGAPENGGKAAGDRRQNVLRARR